MVIQKLLNKSVSAFFAKYSCVILAQGTWKLIDLYSAIMNYIGLAILEGQINR